MNSRLLLVVAAVVLVGLGAGWMVYQQDDGATTTTVPASSDTSSPIVEHEALAVKDMSLGNPMAQVQVVEYASFTCPHCAAFHTNVFKPLRENYIDNDKIRFVFREVYFDQFGLVASVIGRCSGSSADYFSYIDKVFSEQRQWMASREGNKMVNELIAMGKSGGLTDEQIQACLSDEKQGETLVKWYQQNAKADGIRATPSFVVNGKLLSNMNYEEFAKVLDEALGL